MSSVTDPIAQGLARGWKVFNSRGSGASGGEPTPEAPAALTCDVAIVGSGAGAGITAEVLTRAGLDVVIVEEGPLRSSRDFNQRESEAYPQLYQESAARKTADKAINILQGRCVGGSTTVNWTSSFRTPAPTLEYWATHFGLRDFDRDTLAPFWDQAEKRLNIGPWLVPPNENNDLLRRGAAKLGIPAAAILRNVKACWNLGSCGMGCPTNAKQSMLVTSVPAALDAGARLLVETQAVRFEFSGSGDQTRANTLVCRRVAANGAPLAGSTGEIRISAKHFVVGAGAINSPALLLRSAAPDPHQRLGQRTFLHPVVMTAGVFSQEVAGWYGAPQTIYTDHFLDTQPIDGVIGYKLEAPPIHPVIFASTAGGLGKEQAELLRAMPHTHVLLALMRDGFHPESPGGRVTVRDDGSPVLDYPLNAYVMDGARRAMLSMTEIQFAAGAKRVNPIHEQARLYASWSEAKSAINAFDFKPLLTKVVSAHVMGGCGMAGEAKLGVVQPTGVHWQVPNLSVHDGSVFPTSIGANPQLSVYGITNRMAQGLAKRLTGKNVALV